MEYDVIVIGAGLAGLMAADAAQSKGARVLVLSRGLGSLPLTSGCIDGLGYLPNAPRDPVASPLSGVEHLRSARPEHPYAKIGVDAVIKAFGRFQELAGGGGMDYAGSIQANVLLPTSLGTYHPTCLVPGTMKAGDFSLKGPVLLLGMEGLKDFSPFMAAENLNLLHAKGKTDSSFRAEVLKNVSLPGRSMNALSLAGALDEEDFRDRFAERIRILLRPGERLGLPAVLGFHAKESWEDLQRKLRVEIFEIPMPPPSIPGIRLYTLLRRHLQEKGVRMLIGFSALKPLRDGQRVTGFMLGESAIPRYDCRAVVLATGKFIGGGLDSDRSGVRETLFNLPVRYARLRRDWFNRNLLSPEGQPFNRFGLEVNETLKPVGPDGGIVYQNLFAAGGIIAHADSMAEKSGGGVAISTGYVAGSLAAEYK